MHPHTATVRTQTTTAPAAPPTHPAQATLRFGTMAGYVHNGPLHAVGGSWTVPRIAAGSPAGLAATWIGAQGPGAAPSAPFIQVGTNENRGDPGIAANPTVYVAFWSAQQLNFHPHPLFPVAPGDRISAALRLTGGRWQVSIADSTNGRHRAFTTTVDTAGRFGLAEWLQEDPATTSGPPAAYPRIGTVQFAGLSLDGASPSYASVDSQWMSAGSRDFGPSAVRDDAFSVGPVTPSPSGLRYLRIVSPSNAMQLYFDQQVARWSRGTRAAVISPAAARQVDTLQTFGRGLTATSWPADARAAIRALTARIPPLVAVVRQAPAQAGVPADRWRARYETATLALSAAAHRVRRLLHIPEMITATSTRAG